MDDEVLPPAKRDVVTTYRKRARRYNVATNLLYNLVGLRVGHHRRMAASLLGLRHGDTVVELGCGTGANFPFLENLVGDTGKIVGIDLSGEMLTEARKRVQGRGWSNVELRRQDAAFFEYPRPTNAILSAFALTLVPEYDAVVARGCAALGLGGRFVVMDFRMPHGFLARTAPILVFLVKPYGGTLEMADRHPWESLERHVGPTSVREFWLGMAYIAVAEKPKP